MDFVSADDTWPITQGHCCNLVGKFGNCGPYMDIPTRNVICLWILDLNFHYKISKDQDGSIQSSKHGGPE